MSQANSAHAWWSRLRHQGLLLSPVVLVERYPTAPPPAAFPTLPRLRDARTRFESAIDTGKRNSDLDQATILAFVDSLVENFIGHKHERYAKQHDIPEKLTAIVRIGTKSETLRPHRVIYADEAGTTPAVLVMADTSPQVGRGRGRTVYARFLELLRGTGHRLGLLTNGHQFRLIYAGLDFESWCEWESERWFDEGDGTKELCGLRQLLSPTEIPNTTPGIARLLDAIEESRKKQADLSSVLRENVRQAIELLLEEVSTTSRTNAALFAPLVHHNGDRDLSDNEAHEALLQATVRVVMRLVVCLFAESRQLLPTNDPIYAQSYGVRSLYELLDEAIRHEGSTHALFNRNSAWARLMALFRLVHGGSSHGAFPLRPYGGALFRPGDEKNADPVARALHILEHDIKVADATVYYVLRKLLRGPLPVIKGKSKTFVDGPVDYTDLRTEFIGLIYEGLLDYRVKRTDEETGPQVFLNLGREPVLPLSRLTDMLTGDKKALKDLLVTLRKEKVTATASEEDAGDDEEAAEETGETTDADSSPDETATDEPLVELEDAAVEIAPSGKNLDAVDSAKQWAREAVVVAGLVRKQHKKESDSQYQQEVEAEATRLIKRDAFGQPMVKSVGEFYLVRAGNTRKGTGTFYTRPQLAVPTVHRTLQPLCYDKADDGTLTPKPPEDILALKVCDPACGSASFLVAALHYLTDALYKSLCHHRQLDDPAQSKKLTLPYGRPRTNKEGEELVPFPPNDPQRGDTFAERVQALLRRHVVERCIYGVDINPLAVELARVSLWVETLDPELPFSFLDHKIKVGNSLVGCWFDQLSDYPIMAWTRLQREPDKKGPLKAHSVAIKSQLSVAIKGDLRRWIDDNGPQKQFEFFEGVSPSTTHDELTRELEHVHSLPMTAEGIVERELAYRTEFQEDKEAQDVRHAMDRWCAIWFWPASRVDECPTPSLFSKALPSNVHELSNGLAQKHRFFHWELEFPDVFHATRSGFDAVVGNPPWDTSKPKSHEFFTDFDPLFRTYSKEDAKVRQQELFAADERIEREWLNYCADFAAMSNWVGNAFNPSGYASRTADGPSPFNLMDSGPQWRASDAYHARWKAMRADRVGYSHTQHPFRHQGGADVNLYKLFLELSYSLLNAGGRIGMIVPSGIYADSETLSLRRLFLDKSAWEWLFSFENKNSIFDIHRSQKFAAIVVERSAKASLLNAAFMVHDLSEWETTQPPVFQLDKAIIPLFSPRSRTLPEVRTERDLAICRSIYNRSIRIGDKEATWPISYSCEFHLTNDASQFPALDRWRRDGFAPNGFGRWTGSTDDVALPLYEGRMIGQFDVAEKGWVSGKGRTAIWREVPFENKTLEPQYLMDVAYFSGRDDPRQLKVAFMDITSATNARTMIASVVGGFPCGNSAPVLSLDGHPICGTLLLSAFLNSLAFDFVARQRTGGLHLNWFVVDECPLPRLDSDDSCRMSVNRLASIAARLSLLQRAFAVLWLKLKSVYPELAEREWKHWWAVTEADRLRLRVEIDALCADLYGLDPDDFDWIVRDDPKDPKGFYRVDRQLPFRERLTGLAAAAFRALKEGRWSAESAAKLSNDEFFDLLGIPELTNPAAAHAKGLPGPLIEKRQGCHTWKPETFPPEDPRHGWTWDDCHKDAVALLGSEEAVQKYIEGEPETEKSTEKEANQEGPKDLFGDPIPVKPKQSRLGFGE